MHTAVPVNGTGDGHWSDGRNPLVVDVAQGMANNALHHEVTNSAGLVVANDGVLHCVRDGIDHGVHGRYVGGRHVSLPCVNSGENSGESPASLPSPGCLLLLFKNSRTPLVLLSVSLLLLLPCAQ